MNGDDDPIEVVFKDLYNRISELEEVLREFLLEKPLTQFTRNKLLEKLASGGEKEDVMYPIEGKVGSPHIIPTRNLSNLKKQKKNLRGKLIKKKLLK